MAANANAFASPGRSIRQAELLVLDEATSSLDNRTDAEVMEAIEALDRQLTVILIAHRLTIVRNCDRIVVTEKDGSPALAPMSSLSPATAASVLWSFRHQPQPPILIAQMKPVILAGCLGTLISEDTHLKLKPMIEISRHCFLRVPGVRTAVETNLHSPCCP